jgi:hypothetical protein
MEDDPIKPGAKVAFPLAVKPAPFAPVEQRMQRATVTRVDGAAVGVIYQFRGEDHRRVVDRRLLTVGW